MLCKVHYILEIAPTDAHRLGGGDQIYNDGIRVKGPLRAWTDIANPIVCAPLLLLLRRILSLATSFSLRSCRYPMLLNSLRPLEPYMRSRADSNVDQKRRDFPFPEELRLRCDEYYVNNYIRW